MTTAALFPRVRGDGVCVLFCVCVCEGKQIYDHYDQFLTNIIIIHLVFGTTCLIDMGTGARSGFITTIRPIAPTRLHQLLPNTTKYIKGSTIQQGNIPRTKPKKCAENGG